MKLANFFILLLSFNLISVERDQLDVDFLSDDEYRIDLIFIKYLKDEDLKENFQKPEVNFERFFVALNEFQYPNLDIVPTNFEIPKENWKFHGNEMEVWKFLRKIYFIFICSLGISKLLYHFHEISNFP